MLLQYYCDTIVIDKRQIRLILYFTYDVFKPL